MTRRRLVLYGVPVLLGGAFAALWIRLVGGTALIDGLREAHPVALVSMLAATSWWLAVRFVRWQFLLRRAGARVPIRPSLAIYLAGLPGTATPAYVGELIRGVFLRRDHGIPLGVSTGVLVLERCWDLAVLGALLVTFAGSWSDAAIGAVSLAVALGVALTLKAIAWRRGTPPAVRTRLVAPTTLIWSAGLSVAAWAAVVLLPALAAWGLGEGLGPAQGGRVFARSTLLGALTLLPAGIGATGSVMIFELRDAGMALARAVTLVSLVRLAGAGFAVSLGAGFLWHRLRSGRRSHAAPAAVHFDDIATEYSAQFAPHVWDLLLDRKLGLIERALPQPPACAGLGLDLGCGLGRQTAELARRGYRVVGIDPAAQLLAHGAGGGDYAAADALALPFPDRTFDFVYVIGVLHHLAGRHGQDAAYQEVRRVLRPGGALLIHETNPRNPLFRFYMGYLFPMLKRIDEGTEWWVEPARLPDVNGFRVERIEYFTFLPDFTPRTLLPWALRLERRLERGRWREYSAHYMAVLRRPE